MDKTVYHGSSRVLQTPPTTRVLTPDERPSRSRERCDDERRSRGRRSRARCSRGRTSRVTRSRSPVFPVSKPSGNAEKKEESRKRSSRSPPRSFVYTGLPRSPSRDGTRNRSPSRYRSQRSRSPQRGDYHSRSSQSGDHHSRSSQSDHHRSRSSQKGDHLSRSSSRAYSRNTVKQERRSRSRHRRSRSRGGSGRGQKDDKAGMSNLFDNVNMNVNFTDFMKFMQTCVKPSLIQKLHYDKNMIPEFDPTVKNHRIETWISKVNECARIYEWTDQQTAHFALPRLVGHAKKWYEGLQSIDRSWADWQVYLKRAFPSEANYGILLSEMLDRRHKPGESLDEYYYDKMVLLNACEISKKKAVDCIIHGIEDKTIKASASSARFTEPEDLLGYLKDMCREPNDKTRKPPKVYAIGDLVKIKKQVNNDGQSKKLLPVFSGPYKITKILDNDRYEVSSIQGSNLGSKKYCNVWAVDQIQPWISYYVNSGSSESDSDKE